MPPQFYQEVSAAKYYGTDKPTIPQARNGRVCLNVVSTSYMVAKYNIMLQVRIIISVSLC
jgi:hypothetical protein